MAETLDTLSNDNTRLRRALLVVLSDADDALDQTNGVVMTPALALARRALMEIAGVADRTLQGFGVFSGPTPSPMAERAAKRSGVARGKNPKGK